jgi:type 1 glutamine amidotransferase
LTVLLAAGMTLPAMAQPKKILVVSTTTGFRHSSIPTAEKVLGELAKETGVFAIEYVKQPDNEPKPPKKLDPNADDAAKAKFAEDNAAFKAAKAAWDAQMKKNLAKLSPENLKNFDGVIFANTTGDLPLPDPQGFIDWIAAGHAFVGMHSASDTFHGFRPYIEMLGGEFKSHGAQAAVEASNDDAQCSACKHLPGTWKVFDEIYLMRSYDRTKVHNLLSLDKEPNSKAPGHYPLSWNREFGKGRVFYTSLGHREDIWDANTPANFKRMNSPEVAKEYQKHIMGGIKWTLGLESCSATPQTK